MKYWNHHLHFGFATNLFNLSCHMLCKINATKDLTLWLKYQTVFSQSIRRCNIRSHLARCESNATHTESLTVKAWAERLEKWENTIGLKCLLHTPIWQDSPASPSSSPRKTWSGMIINTFHKCNIKKTVQNNPNLSQRKSRKWKFRNDACWMYLGSAMLSAVRL